MSQRTESECNGALSDEILVAYADGELPEQEAAWVEERLHSDEAAAQRLRGLVEAGELARRAFAPVLSEPIPQRVVETVLSPTRPAARAGADVVALPKRRTVAWKPWAMAAGLAVCVAGGLALSIGGGNESQVAQPTPEMQEMLSTQPSYASVETAEGSAMALSTFEARDGRLCREFEVLTETSFRQGVACSPPDEPAWTVVALSERDITGTQGDTFRPAGDRESDPLAEVVQSLQRGHLLDEEGERRALERLE